MSGLELKRETAEDTKTFILSISQKVQVQVSDSYKESKKSPIPLHGPADYTIVSLINQGQGKMIFMYECTVKDVRQLLDVVDEFHRSKMTPSLSLEEYRRLVHVDEAQLPESSDVYAVYRRIQNARQFTIFHVTNDFKQRVRVEPMNVMIPACEGTFPCRGVDTLMEACKE